MPKRPDGSIARSTFVGVLLTCLVVMATWETIVLAREWRARRREIVAAGELVAHRLANTLSAPLWNYDREEVGRAVEFEIHSPGILAVIVENDQGGTEAAQARQTSGRVVPFSPEREGAVLLRDSLASSRQPVLKLEKRVGSVVVHVSRAHLRGQLVHAVWSRVGELLLLVSAILGVVYLVIARRIIGPITALDRSIAAMPADRPRAIPVVGDGRGAPARRVVQRDRREARRRLRRAAPPRRRTGQPAGALLVAGRRTSPASSSASPRRPSAGCTTSARTSPPSPALRARSSSVRRAGDSTS